MAKLEGLSFSGGVSEWLNPAREHQAAKQTKLLCSFASPAVNTLIYFGLKNPNNHKEKAPIRHCPNPNLVLNRNRGLRRIKITMTIMIRTPPPFAEDGQRTNKNITSTMSQD